LRELNFASAAFAVLFFGTWPGNELQPGLVTRDFFFIFGVHIDNYGHHSPKFTQIHHPPSPPMITKITIFFFWGGKIGGTMNFF